MTTSFATGAASSLIDWLAMLTVGDRPQPPSEEMRQAQAAFRSLIDSLPLALVIKDAAGRRVLANKSYLAAHHKTLEEVLGKTDAELFPADIARQYTADDERVLRTGELQ